MVYLINDFGGSGGKIWHKPPNRPTFDLHNLASILYKSATYLDKPRPAGNWAELVLAWITSLTRVGTLIIALSRVKLYIVGSKRMVGSKWKQRRQRKREKQTNSCHQSPSILSAFHIFQFGLCFVACLFQCSKASLCSINRPPSPHSLKSMISLNHYFSASSSDPILFYLPNRCFCMWNGNRDNIHFYKQILSADTKWGQV